MTRWCPARQADCRDDCKAGPCLLATLVHVGRRQGPWQLYPDPAVMGYTTTDDGGW
jgi:hypothetical protein